VARFRQYLINKGWWNHEKEEYIFWDLTIVLALGQTRFDQFLFFKRLI
jgi:hypothetical protein